MHSPIASASPDLIGPTQASRVRAFATFFKSYMSIWALVVAALPIPVGAFKLIPTFEVQRPYLSVYTSLFCFLSLGFIFFQRHRLGYYMFGSVLGSSIYGVGRFMIVRATVNWLPFACIILSVFAVFRYHVLLNDAILIGQAQAIAEEAKGVIDNAFLVDLAESRYVGQKVTIANLMLFENATTLAATRGKTGDQLIAATISEAGAKSRRFGSWPPKVSQAARDYPGQGFSDAQTFLGVGVIVPSAEDVLKRKLVPLSTDLLLWYLTIFVTAETAFILMALKEYLQDLAHISDLSLMEVTERATAASSGA